MPEQIAINLTPTYPVTLKLTGNTGGQIEFKRTADQVPLVLQPILRGEKGDAGTTARYVHTQSIAAAIWTVAHNLNARPSVMVCDHLDRVIAPDVEYIDANIVRVTHASAITGFVYCN